MIAICRIVSLVLLGTCCFALKKGCRMSQLDAKMKPITRLVRDMNWPQNNQEMDVICRTYLTHTYEARNFTKNCAEKDSKIILGVVIHSMDGIIRLYCKNKKLNVRKRFIASGKCTKKGGKTASKCWNKMLSSMAASVDNKKRKDKINSLCCSLWNWRDCLIKTYEDIGGLDCTLDHIEQINHFLQKAIINSLNVFCSEYDNTCDRFNEFLSRSQQKPDYKTPFPDIVTILDSP